MLISSRTVHTVSLMLGGTLRKSTDARGIQVEEGAWTDRKTNSLCNMNVGQSGMVRKLNAGSNETGTSFLLIFSIITPSGYLV